VEEWERKAHARARRKRALEDSLDTRTRRIASGSDYKRGFKHRPSDVEVWESLD